MRLISKAIYEILHGNATLRQLVGSYMDDHNEIWKFFSGYAPIKEGSKADFPFIIYYHQYKAVPVKARKIVQYDVTAELQVVSEDHYS